MSEFDKVIQEIIALHAKKQADYGTASDPFANIRASQRFSIPPWLGAVLRANDKISRIQSFCVNGNLKNESLEDSLMDLAVYAIIALALRREELNAAKENKIDPEVIERQQKYPFTTPTGYRYRIDQWGYREYAEAAD